MCDDDGPSMPADAGDAEDEMECICTPKESAKKPPKERELGDRCPYDPRFPNTNQTRRCWLNFVDYHRCTRLLGNYQGCRIFKMCYETLCPDQWLERWFAQMDEGTFPFTFPNKVEGMELPDESEPFDPTGY